MENGKNRKNPTERKWEKGNFYVILSASFQIYMENINKYT